MPGVERGQARGAVQYPVTLIAHTDAGFFHQPHGQGGGFSAVIAVGAQVVLHLLAQIGQRLGKTQQFEVLGMIANLVPMLVVAVLLAARLVDARGLEMPLGVFADPDIVPGRG